MRPGPKLALNYATSGAIGTRVLLVYWNGQKIRNTNYEIRNTRYEIRRVIYFTPVNVESEDSDLTRGFSQSFLVIGLLVTGSHSQLRCLVITIQYSILVKAQVYHSRYLDLQAVLLARSGSRSTASGCSKSH